MSGRVIDDEIGVLGISPDERLDERADRDNVEPPAAGVVECTRHERCPQSAAAEMRVDLGVEEGDHPTPAVAVDELARRLTLGQQHVPTLVGAILDGEVVVGQAVRLTPDRLER